MQAFKKLLSNKPFIFVGLSISTLYFVVAGIQFWASNYFLEIIGVTYKQVTFWYSLCSISGPLAGALLSAPLINKVGGIESDNALLFCTANAFLCCVVALPVPLVDQYPILIVLIWFILFFGGILMCIR